MKTFIPCWFVYLWMVGFLTPVTSSHAHLSVLTFAELVQKSKYIIVGEVLETKRRWDGSMLSHVKVERAIKGTPANKMLVSYGQVYNAAQEDSTQLKVGHHYLFYISDYDKKLYLLGVTGKDYHLINNNNVLCDDYNRTTLEVCIERIRKEAYSK